ncbi:hypothetical protein IWQ60_006587 [Tieghemiomyces parasiticus]|uniref:tRNA N(3)-methylcytidine methyltransferase n=1 Tax=Tieghemiomyces parasiticus TaxID=78921 RepID=A0A9W8DTC8_9FUNG|nr:hypothetical protein IWQ60_006587 [Tieghemiomyces parasiticus]
MPSEPKTTTSVRDIADTAASANETPRFGSRTLQAADDVFTQNAWDHAEWTEEQEAQAREAVLRQLEHPVPAEDQGRYHAEAAENWNRFYAKNENRFFKDRHWLRIEFPELFKTERAVGHGGSDDDGAQAPPAQITREPGRRFNVMEIGCGAGNAFFPLLAENQADPDYYAYACDFSETAVRVVRENALYDPARSEAFVWDLTSPELPPSVAPGSVDVILLVFVLSAIHPDHWQQAMDNLYKLLRPGGIVLFRDYGRYDLAQLRFKRNRLLSDNFYVRGDGTRVYFFTNEQLAELFGQRFEVLQNAVDRRLIVNRHKKLQMFRVWLQGKFRKPLT